MCFFPAFIAAGVLMFTVPLIVDGRLPPLDALQRSWRALKGEWLAGRDFHLVVNVIAGLGACCCCVGQFFTMPLYCLAIAVLYRDVFLAGKGFPTDKPASPDPYF